MLLAVADRGRYTLSEPVDISGVVIVSNQFDVQTVFSPLGNLFLILLKNAACYKYGTKPHDGATSFNFLFTPFDL